MDKVASNPLAINGDYSEPLTLSLRLSNDKKKNVSVQRFGMLFLLLRKAVRVYINIRVFHEISYGGANVNYKRK